MKIEYFSAAVRLYAPTIVLFAKWLRARFQQLARSENVETGGWPGGGGPLHAPPGDAEVELRLSHPAGFEGAWRTYDPRERGGVVEPEVLPDGSVQLLQRPGESVPRAFYVLPSGSPTDPRGLRLSLAAARSSRALPKYSASLRCF